jgi:hypothetical protein
MAPKTTAEIRNAIVDLYDKAVRLQQSKILTDSDSFGRETFVSYSSSDMPMLMSTSAYIGTLGWKPYIPTDTGPILGDSDLIESPRAEEIRRNADGEVVFWCEWCSLPTVADRYNCCSRCGGYPPSLDPYNIASGGD